MKTYDTYDCNNIKKKIRQFITDCEESSDYYIRKMFSEEFLATLTNCEINELFCYMENGLTCKVFKVKNKTGL